MEYWQYESKSKTYRQWYYTALAFNIIMTILFEAIFINHKYIIETISLCILILSNNILYHANKKLYETYFDEPYNSTEENFILKHHLKIINLLSFFSAIFILIVN